MSFASYASQYISRAPAASSASTAQPLFFSFTTDEASQHLELEIDDAADPHLEADDPYLRLDDDEVASEGSESPPGWLAHQRSPSPPRRNRQLRSPSPPRRPPPRSPTPPPVSLLTSSLLPQRTPSFGLATPGKRRRTPLPDAPFAAAFLAAVSIALLSAFLAPLLLPPSSTPLPLLHTLPLLCALTVLAALLSYTHLLLLRLALRPILLLSALTPPLALLISSILLLLSPLRILALLPLPFFLLTLHRLPNTLHRLSRTPRALGLSTRTLYTRTPLLLAVSPVALLFALIASLPPLALLVRLALARSWILGTLLAATLVLAWGVLRSAQRAVVAGVVGAWWNAWVPPSSSSSSSTTTDTSLPQSLLTLHHALVSPVLGTLVLCALFGVLHALLDGVAAALRFLPMALPYKVVALFSAHLLDIVGRATERVGGGRVVGVYCALTGGDRGFWAGVKGVRELDGRGPPPALPLPRPWTLALPFALVAYLRAAGDRDVDPSNPGAGYAAALGAALLAGTVCAAVSVFCGGVVRDCADTLYVCVALDRAAGAPRRPGEGRNEVWEGFDPSPEDLPGPRDAETGLAGFAGLNLGGFNLPFGGLNRAFGGGAQEAGGGGRGVRAPLLAQEEEEDAEPAYVRMRRTSEEENRKVPPPPPTEHARREHPHKRQESAQARREPEPAHLRREPEPMQVRPPPPPPHVDSDSDSLDSDGGRGAESSGMFPGSGFF